MAGEAKPDKHPCMGNTLASWEGLRQDLGIQGLSSSPSISFLILKVLCVKLAAELSKSPIYAGQHMGVLLCRYVCMTGSVLPRVAGA